MIDITIPHDENLVKVEKDKLSKYLDLAHEVTALWDVDSTIIVPIVIVKTTSSEEEINQPSRTLEIPSLLNSPKKTKLNKIIKS
ncbi:hypothetical protein evm_005062 [Chilo suppressalis]|nr:hypothetical protein evm_005062 [Chilo suppressalis]